MRYLTTAYEREKSAKRAFHCLRRGNESSSEKPYEKFFLIGLFLYGCGKVCIDKSNLK